MTLHASEMKTQLEIQKNDIMAQQEARCLQLQKKHADDIAQQRIELETYFKEAMFTAENRFSEELSDAIQHRQAELEATHAQQICLMELRFKESSSNELRSRENDHLLETSEMERRLALLREQISDMKLAHRDEMSKELRDQQEQLSHRFKVESEQLLDQHKATVDKLRQDKKELLASHAREIDALHSNYAAKLEQRHVHMEELRGQMHQDNNTKLQEAIVRYEGISKSLRDKLAQEMDQHAHQLQELDKKFHVTLTDRENYHNLMINNLKDAHNAELSHLATMTANTAKTHEMELRSTVSRYEAKIDEAQATSRLTLRQEMIEKERQYSMEFMKKMDETTKSFNEKIAALTADKAASESTHAEQLTVATAKVRQLGDEIRSLTEAHDIERRDLNQKLLEATESKDFNAKKLTVELEQRLRDKENEWLTEKQSIIAKHLEEINSIQLASDSQRVGAVTMEAKRFNARLREKDDEIDRLRAEHTRDRAQLIGELESANALRVSAASDSYRAEIEKYTSQIQLINEKAAEQLMSERQRLVSEHKKEIDSLRSQHAEAVGRAEKKSQELHKEELSFLSSSHKQEIMKLASSHDELVNGIESKHSAQLESERQVIREKTARISELESITRGNDRQITSLLQQYESLVREKENEVTRAVAEFEYKLNNERSQFAVSLEESIKRALVTQSDEIGLSHNKVIKRILRTYVLIYR